MKFAQDGAFMMLNVKGLPSGSPAAGVNEYSAPPAILVAGVPEMVGELSAAGSTWMENAGSEMGAAAVLTLITILPNVPAFAVVGVPESDPVAVLKVAQAGRLTIEKLRSAAVGLVTTGVKL